MIETAITTWIVKSVETQGITMGLLLISFYWLTKRIEYLDKQIAIYNAFMRECIEEKIHQGPTDQFRGR